MDSDIYRDTPLRYLGYANEVGEAFRALVPTKAVWFTYGVACAYVCCDAADKGITASKNVPSENHTEVRKHTIMMACDALAWQSLASVIMPGFTINRLCWASRLALSTAAKLPKPVSNYISLAVGLAAIPFIIKPIDHFVDHCMDLTLRPWLFRTKD